MKKSSAIFLYGAVICALLAAYSAAPPPGHINERRITARTMWQDRCKKSGEFIYKTIDDVEGVVLLKIRERNNDFDQFSTGDLYGRDVVGLAYIMSFLKGYLMDGRTKYGSDYEELGKRGYNYVIATDPSDGRRYRYTGRLEEPWQTDNSYLNGYIRMVVEKIPSSHVMPRYGITFEDISTRLDREYWIAGSSLKVIDLETGEVIAERIGYMYDRAQGSRAGARSPWLLAADNACPAFGGYSDNIRVHATTAQIGQTVRFVEKVLHPAQ